MVAFVLQAVERRGEMIVRILEPRCIGGKQAVEAAHKLMSKGDARHTVQVSSVAKQCKVAIIPPICFYLHLRLAC